MTDLLDKTLSDEQMDTIMRTTLSDEQMDNIMRGTCVEATVLKPAPNRQLCRSTTCINWWCRSGHRRVAINLASSLAPGTSRRPSASWAVWLPRSSLCFKTLDEDLCGSA